jgi:putative FmdB family regulatory protein
MGGVEQMPIYDYRCKKCGDRFTVMVSINDRDKVACSKCGSPEVEQLISACSIKVGGCGGGTKLKAGGG